MRRELKVHFVKDIFELWTWQESHEERIESHEEGGRQRPNRGRNLMRRELKASSLKAGSSGLKPNLMRRELKENTFCQQINPRLKL